MSEAETDLEKMMPWTGSSQNRRHVCSCGLESGLLLATHCPLLVEAQMQEVLRCDPLP